MPTIRRRPKGSWFSVVLRHPGFSLAATAATGALGGSFAAPRPALEPRCVCCDVETSATVPFSIDTDRVQGDPVPVPACPTCAGHLDRSTAGAQIMAAGLCVGIGLIGVAFATPNVTIGLVGLGLLAVSIAFLLRKRAARRRLATDGHHTGLEIMLHPGQCLVRTTNPRVAAALAQRHAHELHRATLLDDPI